MNRNCKGVILSGSDDYTGGTIVETGMLYVTKSNALPDGSSLTIGTGGTFVFDPSVGVAPGESVSGEASPGAVVGVVPEAGTLALSAVAGIVVAAAARPRRRLGIAWRSLRPCWIGLLAALAGPAAAWGQYSFTTTYDQSVNAWEYNLFENNFQFGVFMVQGMPDSGQIGRYGPGMLIFRPHPDQADINGWGSSLYLNPFLSTGQPGNGTLDQPTVTASGIVVTANGLVNSDTAGNTNYGTFALSATFCCDMTAQQLTGSASLQVTLSGSLAGANSADLNLVRISSNRLSNVPLVGGGVGNTGDMTKVSVSYGSSGNDPNNFDWVPSVSSATYPSYSSSALSTNVIGAVNNVDGLALGGASLAIATKPTLNLTLASSNGASLLSAGMQYATAAAQDPYADNIGIVQQVLSKTTSSTSFGFSLQIGSAAPATWNGASSSSWSNSGSWQGGATPHDSGLLRFGQVAGPGNQLVSNNDLTAGMLVNGIEFSNSASGYTLTGNSIQLGGTVINESNNNQTISLPLELAPAGGQFDTWPANITVAGPVSGSGPLVKTGPGLLILNGDNTYMGGTAVNDGTLEVLASDAIPSGSNLTVGTNGTVEFGSPLGATGTMVATFHAASPPGAVAVVPEPAALALLGVAGIIAAAATWRRRKGI